MYEARQHKEATSRTLQQPGRKGTQQLKMRDNRGKAMQLLPSLKGNIIQLASAADFQQFSADTQQVSMSIGAYETSFQSLTDFRRYSHSTGLSHWINETTEAGRRKYAELNALNDLHAQGVDIRFGCNNTLEPDLVTPCALAPNTAVEVKRTIGDNSAVNYFINEADSQLYSRYNGTNTSKIIYIEIANPTNKWPWHGGALHPDPSTLPNKTLEQLQKIKQPCVLDKLIVLYPNGSPLGLTRIVCDVSKTAKGVIDGCTTTYQ